jgi:hypothetical protein
MNYSRQINSLLISYFSYFENYATFKYDDDISRKVHGFEYVNDTVLWLSGKTRKETAVINVIISLH